MLPPSCKVSPAAENKKTTGMPASGRGPMTSVHPLAPVGSEPRDDTYNLFRNKLRPNIMCVVPEYSPVPTFVTAEDWTFDQALRPSDETPPGFCNQAAQTGMRFNSYYLFQTTVAVRSSSAA